MKLNRQKSQDYTTINIGILRDQRVSLKAKGFFLTVMGLPDSWNFSVKGMISILKEGEDAIYSIIQELESFGYCERTRTREGNGQLGTVSYEFFESPHRAFPDVVEPDVENPDQYNKEDLKECGLKNKEKEHMSKLRSDACEVIEDWKTQMNHPRAICDTKKQGFVIARLREKFTVDQLKRVLLGVKKDAWYMGDNPTKKKYDQIENIYLSASRVEKFLTLAGDDVQGCLICANDPNRNLMSFKEPGWIYQLETSSVVPCVCNSQYVSN